MVILHQALSGCSCPRKHSNVAGICTELLALGCAAVYVNVHYTSDHASPCICTAHPRVHNCLQAEAALSGLNGQVLDAGSRPLSAIRARPRTMTAGTTMSNSYGPRSGPQTAYPGVCGLLC